MNRQGSESTYGIGGPVRTVMSRRPSPSLPSRSSVWSSEGPGWQSSSIRIYVLACLAGIGVGLLCVHSPWLALVSLPGILFCVVALSKPLSLCYLAITAVALVSGMERDRWLPLLSPNEVSLVLSVAIAAVVTLANRRLLFGGLRYAATAFVLLIGGTVFIPVVVYLEQGTPLTIDNAFNLFSSMQYFLLFWLFATLVQSEVDRRRLIGWMLACGSVVALVGLLQALGFGFVTGLLADFYASSHLDMAARAGRVTSLLGAWNGLGIFMMFNILIAWAVLPSIIKPAARAGATAAMGLSAACLLASGSWAGILGSIMGVVLLTALAHRRMPSGRALVLGSAGILVAILLLQPLLQPLVAHRLAYQYRYGGPVPQTLAYRFEVWREIFLPAIRQHFPWPVNPTIPSSFAWRNGESQYLLLLFRTGLSGLLGHLLWIGFTIAWLYRIRRRSTGFTNVMASTALTLVIMLSIVGLTNEVFSYAGVADYLWIMLALVASSQEKSS